MSSTSTSRTRRILGTVAIASLAFGSVGIGAANASTKKAKSTKSAKSTTKAKAKTTKAAANTPAYTPTTVKK